MSSRHQAREVALQILYRYDVAVSSGTPIPAGQELIKDLQSHFNHFQVPQDSREFVAELVAGTLTDIARLDALVEEHASNWKVSRMGFVDRCLLRMASYEMGHFPETPPSVVIDEAVELGKKFGTSDTPAFINGVLDAVKAAIKTTPKASN